MEITKFTYFYPERPGLIHIDQPLFSRLSDDPAWIAEPKFNGSRLELHRLPSGIWEFWNRHGEKFNYSPSPEVSTALAEMPLEDGKYYLFDGELRHNKTVGVRQKIVLYDIFVLAGDLLTSVPFDRRRGALEYFNKRGGCSEALTIAPQYLDGFREVFKALITDPEIEGLVMKRLNGRLDLGRKTAANSAWMMKVRKPNNSYRF